MQQEQLQQRMTSVFSCFERAKLETDDVQCRQLLLLACKEQAALKEIVRNLTAGEGACVLMEFQMKAQESLVNIERGLKTMREEIIVKLYLMDSKIDTLLGRDVLEHMGRQTKIFLDGFPRLPVVVYVESKLLEEGKLKDFQEDESNKSEPAMNKLRGLWEKRLKKEHVIDSLLVTGYAGTLFA